MAILSVSTCFCCLTNLVPAFKELAFALHYRFGASSHVRIIIGGVIRKFAMLPFLHRSINRAGITTYNTAKHMQLIGYNMLDVSRLRALQLSSRQRYIA